MPSSSVGGAPTRGGGAPSASLFQAVRAFSHGESVIFAALLVVWLGHIDEDAKFWLGLTHGVGFLTLCLVIYIGCLRRVFPWPLLAAVILLSPFGSSVGIEVLNRRERDSAGEVLEPGCLQ